VEPAPLAEAAEAPAAAGPQDIPSSAAEVVATAAASVDAVSPAEAISAEPAPAARKPRKAAPRKTATASAPEAPAAAPAAKPAAKRAPAKRTPAAAKKTTAAPAADTEGDPAMSGAPAVKPGEEPWTELELAEVREELLQERQTLSEEIESANALLADMLREGLDGAGDDQADAGSRTFDREQEISLAANAKEIRDQVERALKRLDDGTYGVCENCHQPIGKMRLQAFPKATLCLACKERQERR
jgi:RNA polymerase-binding protein DksA